MRTTLSQWLKGIRIEHVAYSRAAPYYDRRSRGLGLVVTVLSVFVGTSLFTGFASSKNLGIVVLVAGAVSAVTAVLAGAQTFLNYAQLAEKSRNSANGYGTLRRKLEEALADTTDNQKLASVMDDIGKEWDQLELESPTISEQIYSGAKAYVETEMHDSTRVTH